MSQVNGSPRSALPPVGDPALLQDFLHDSVGSLRRLHQTCGTIAAFLKGQGCSIFAFGPEYNRLLLANPEVFYLSSGFPGPKKSAQRRFGTGLFGLNGETHTRHRRLLMPPFRKEAVESYRDMLVLLSEQFVAGWRPGQVIDLAAQVKEFALRVSSKLLFGIEDLDQAHAIGAAFEPWMDLNHEMFFAAALPIDCPEGHYERMLEAADHLERELLTLIDQKVATGTNRPDLLSILLQARAAGDLSDVEVMGHTHTLFNAAYHTTTAALTWTLFLLAQHPSVMAELLDELDGVLGGAAPTVPQLARLNLLDRVIKESLRVLPPVVYSPRVNMVATAFGPYQLAKGTMVVASHYITHHLPEIFPEPERFLPDRWLRTAPSPYAYLPFGAGSRMCVGAPLALLMLKVAVPVIVQRVRLQVVPGVRIDRHCTLTLGPRAGIPMEVHAQDHRFSASPVLGNIHDLVELPGGVVEREAA